MRCRFAQWTLDLDNYCLLHAGEPLAVRPKTFKLLCYFALNPQRLITREEIFEKIWPNRCVSDESLTTCVKELRQILGDSGKIRKFIITRHKLGYQFIQPVVFENTQKTFGQFNDRSQYVYERKIV
ncbi:Phosphate regulon transcriptional regulatory protein PhoB [Thalassocella blandensis]|nr:Phosphate regulon transcriptional regulatory protein PhoB [Thalassocella blandensis]